VKGEIEIRRAGVADAPAIQRLLLELSEALGKGGDFSGREQDLERYGFGDHPRFEALLAFDGDEAVGLAVYFSEYSTWRGYPGVYVQDLYVSRPFRGRGLGRELLDAVRHRAREWGGRYVKLTVYDSNPEALAFYRRLGFESREDELPLVLRY